MHDGASIKRNARLARFTGLGISAFAALAIATAPAQAYADENPDVSSSDDTQGTLTVTLTNSESDATQSDVIDSADATTTTVQTQNDDTQSPISGDNQTAVVEETTETPAKDEESGSDAGDATDANTSETELTEVPVADGQNTETSDDATSTDAEVAEGNDQAQNADDTEQSGVEEVQEQPAQDDESKPEQVADSSDDDDAPKPANPATTAAAPAASTSTSSTPKEVVTTAAPSPKLKAQSTEDQDTQGATTATSDTQATSEDAELTAASAKDPDANWKGGHWLLKKYKNLGVKRFWVGADGKILKNRLVNPHWGVGKKKAGYWAYARKEGYVVTGVYDAGKIVYIANSKGKLIGQKGGWVVSKKYTSDGSYQRYYIDPVKHGAIEGYAAKQGSVYAHYTIPGKGYVVRGKWHDNKGHVWLGNNSGRLPNDGWLITGKYDNGNLQRYYIVGNACRTGFFRAKDGGKTHAYYGKKKAGYVLRKTQVIQGSWTVANNDGWLKTGFYKTSKFGQGKQLYYFDRYGRMAKNRVVTTEEGAKFNAWAKPDGTILKGKLVKGSYMLLADSNGKLAWGTGFINTGTYDNGSKKLYYIAKDSKTGAYGAKLGLFKVNNNEYYGLPKKGYLLRSATKTVNGRTLIADNKGVLMSNSSIVAKAIAAARSQIGTAYTTEGSAYYPGVAFNCSGLTWWAYYKAGVNLSHAQGYYSYYTGYANKKDSQMWQVYSKGNWVYKYSQLKPGDLVFFTPLDVKTNRIYNTGHVGLYIGNGKMIDAGYDGVKIRSVKRATFVGGGSPLSK